MCCAAALLVPLCSHSRGAVRLFRRTAGATRPVHAVANAAMRCADVEALNRIFELKPEMAGRSDGHRDELEEHFEAQFVCAADRPRDLTEYYRMLTKRDTTRGERTERNT